MLKKLCNIPSQIIDRIFVMLIFLIHKSDLFSKALLFLFPVVHGLVGLQLVNRIPEIASVIITLHLGKWLVIYEQGFC